MSHTQHKKRFTLKRQELPFEVEVRPEEWVTYTLREMNGTLRDEWMQLNQQRIVIGATPAQNQISDFTGMYALLLTRCVYNNNGHLVTEEEVQSWPATMQEWLHDEAMKLNGLDAKAKEAAKNASAASTSPG